MKDFDEMTIFFNKKGREFYKYKVFYKYNVVYS